MQTLITILGIIFDAMVVFSLVAILSDLVNKGKTDNSGMTISYIITNIINYPIKVIKTILVLAVTIVFAIITAIIRLIIPSFKMDMPSLSDIS